MHPEATVASVLRLHHDGLNNCEISRRTGVSRSTVREWINGRLPHSYRRKDASGASHVGRCKRCGGDEHALDQLGPAYVHLLGLYLGDGSIATHRRQVYRLRITLDVRYPHIVSECEQAMQAVVPRNRVGRQLRRCNCYEVHAYSKGWPCLSLSTAPGKSTTGVST